MNNTPRRLFFAVLASVEVRERSHAAVEHPPCSLGNVVGSNFGSPHPLAEKLGELSHVPSMGNEDEYVSTLVRLDQSKHSLEVLAPEI